ncbi:hypothetical protein RIB2604_01005160 [Aspergillus luchuensis]|uniref:Uncharacterized protein n=1 Tax=Aspergillus kawachii TaxID=1069201 RepID=A0A146F6E6_ASPKA|nr:hypothetical protein RIB2604_01005160 [Aspergillus luchuensis]
MLIWVITLSSVPSSPRPTLPAGFAHTLPTPRRQLGTPSRLPHTLAEHIYPRANGQLLRGDCLQHRVDINGNRGWFLRWFLTRIVVFKDEMPRKEASISKESTGYSM